MSFSKRGLPFAVFQAWRVPFICMQWPDGRHYVSCVVGPQMALYRKLGYKKDATSPELDIDDPHGYQILSKAVAPLAT